MMKELSLIPTKKEALSTLTNKTGLVSKWLRPNIDKRRIQFMQQQLHQSESPPSTWIQMMSRINRSPLKFSSTSSSKIQPMQQLFQKMKKDLQTQTKSKFINAISEAAGAPPMVQTAYTVVGSVISSYLSADDRLAPIYKYILQRSKTPQQRKVDFFIDYLNHGLHGFKEKYADKNTDNYWNFEFQRCRIDIQSNPKPIDVICIQCSGSFRMRGGVPYIRFEEEELKTCLRQNGIPEHILMLMKSSHLRNTVAYYFVPPYPEIPQH
jgi:hypothetical protein